MLLYFTEHETGNSLAINPKHVVVVFEKVEEDKKFTVINALNGNVAVEGDYLEIVGRINSAQL